MGELTAVNVISVLKWENVARSRYWIWLIEFSSFVINSDSKHSRMKELY